MRTTVDIPDHLFGRLKARAASEGSSVQELILHGLKQLLKENRCMYRGRVKLPIVRSKRSGKLQLDNAKIYGIISFP